MILLSTKLDKQNEQIWSEDTICIHPIDCTEANHIFSRLLEMVRLNKIEGTPILKLAMVKRLKVKKILEKSKFEKVRWKNWSKNSSNNYSSSWNHTT